MNEQYVFNPIINKTPKGPCKLGESVCYMLKISKDIKPTSVFLCMQNDQTKNIEKIKMTIVASDDNYLHYEINPSFNIVGLFWYFFEVWQEEHCFYLEKNEMFDVCPTGKVFNSFVQLVYKSNSKTYKEFKGGIIYHIFVDRFNKEGEVKPKNGMVLRNDWGGDIRKNTTDILKINKEVFGGNIKGIMQKLPYLKSLGVNTIYLSPIFESNSCHKYDTADFMKIDQMFGTDADFIKLINNAKKKDMNIILDGVFNHIGSDSVYFNKENNYNAVGAYQSQQSTYYDWFVFYDYPNKYNCWWGIETLPQVNENNKSFTNFIAGKNGVIDRYMKMGIGGFRLDVVDELSDEFLNKVCTRIRDNKKDALILGEVWEDATIKIAYDQRRNYFSGNQLDSVMNYPIKDAIIEYIKTGNEKSLARTMFLICDHYPLDVQNNLMNILGTHDTSRILTTLECFTHEISAKIKTQISAVDLLKIATIIQYTFVGIPAIFYGDEAGIKGEEAPYCRVCYPWNNQNQTILLWYKTLAKLRKNEVFVDGEINIKTAQNGIMIYERKKCNSKVDIAINCGVSDYKLNNEAPIKNFLTNKTEKDFIILKPYEFVILTNK